MALAVAGGIFALAATFAARFTLRSMLAPARHVLPAVTLLKPLHGAESGLEAALASFLKQDYPGPIQIVFGLRHTGDPAIAVVENLKRRFPARDISVVVDPGIHGSNRKMSNVVNMVKAAKYDYLVLTDSDITVPRDYLSTVVAAAACPGVGIVSCLYSGKGSGNSWSRLSAMGLSYHFLPNATLGIALGVERPCFGSTIALSRQTLTTIGGFESFTGHFVDDYSFDGFDGGAGSRYQAKREIKSFWFPTWLAQPAALVPGQQADRRAAAAHRQPGEVCRFAKDYELCVMHTSTPSFASDVKVAEALKAPTRAEDRLRRRQGRGAAEEEPEGAPIDFVARNEFDFTIKEVAEGRDWAASTASPTATPPARSSTTRTARSWRTWTAALRHRGLQARPAIEDYFIGYLMHPYISIYTGRGCKSRCTFCLWPQTVGGHRYRVRSVGMSPRKSPGEEECSRR
jgi:hypothetical protein